MIITSTPYRVSFMGGGSDYPAYYERYGGQVLTCTIAKYCYLSVRYTPPFLDTKYRVFWAKAEAVDRLEDIQHPSVRGCLRYLNVEEGVEINHAGDLPARSGLGSSSAFTVGLLHALRLLRDESVSRESLAEQAITVEQDVLRETVGIQDQIECAWGGLNLIRFTGGRHYTVEPLGVDWVTSREVEAHLMLMFTGIQRNASDVAAVLVANMGSKLAELHRIVKLVPEAARALRDGDMRAFGAILHEGWMLKRQLSDLVSSEEIDSIYERARRAGAFGGKLLGAGGGGFMLLVCPPDRRAAVLAATGLIEVDFSFEHRGSQVVLVSP